MLHKCEAFLIDSGGIMKFIHISDLHIGKKLFDVSLLEDQKFALNYIIRTASDLLPDAILISGDIYDKSNPTGEAVQLFSAFLAKLEELKINVFIIRGNHDNDLRLEYCDEILSKHKIYIEGSFKKNIKKVTLKDDWGFVNFYLLPYVDVPMVRLFYPDEKIESLNDAFLLLVQDMNINTTERNVLLCHQFVTGALTCQSETISVGGVDSISEGLFSEFDYVALGHIHTPQKFHNPCIRYSGSLLKYSFSECNSVKSMTIVEMENKGPVKIESKEIPFIHNLISLKGKYQDILKEPVTNDYYQIILTDEVLLPDARSVLVDKFENLLEVRLDNSTQCGDDVIPDLNNIITKSPIMLFKDFYLLKKGKEPSLEELDIIEKLLKECEGE